MGAQLKCRSEKREFQTLAAKGQWEVTCLPCGKEFPRVKIYHLNAPKHDGKNSPIDSIEEEEEEDENN